MWQSGLMSQQRCYTTGVGMLQLFCAFLRKGVSSLFRKVTVCVVSLNRGHLKVNLLDVAHQSVFTG